MDVIYTSDNKIHSSLRPKKRSAKSSYLIGQENLVATLLFSRKQSRDIPDFVWVFCLGSSLGKRISLLQFKAIVMNHLLKSLKKQVT